MAPAARRSPTAESRQLPDAQPVRTPAARVIARRGFIAWVIELVAESKCIVLKLTVRMVAAEELGLGSVSPELTARSYYEP
jgi:hypothetical protein